MCLLLNACEAGLLAARAVGAMRAFVKTGHHGRM
jgi:hypothetical protein